MAIFFDGLRVCCVPVPNTLVRTPTHAYAHAHSNAANGKALIVLLNRKAMHWPADARQRNGCSFEIGPAQRENGGRDEMKWKTNKKQFAHII